MFGRKTRAEIQALRAETEGLRHAAELQALVIDDITTAQTKSSTYAGNAYKSYDLVRDALAKAYEGTAAWGVVQTGAIIDTRSAFTIGQGIMAAPAAGMKKAQAANELDFIERFFDFNDLDREGAQAFAQEAEVEGCFLGQLFWDEEEAMVSLRFMSRSHLQYQIETDPKDYAWFKRATWKDPTSGAPLALEEPEFVYVRFGGRAHQPNLPFPKVGKALPKIEDLDKALRDWREINRLFAAPVPHIECQDPAQAKAMAEAIDSVAKNWRMKRLFAHTGTLSFAQPAISGSEALEKEITTLAKMISGTTGVPVHFMGLPDLMSNRATADNLMELVEASTSKERQVWKGGYKEIVGKAMALYNEKTGGAQKSTRLDPAKVTIEIPRVTYETWSRITDVWLPLYLGGAISLDHLLAQIPEVDVEAELERKAERDVKAQEAFERQAANEEEDEDEDDEE